MSVALDNLPNFPGLDGLALSAGYVYIGVANLDPVTNPVSVYWDSALTIPAAQPLRTLAGYVSNSGAPANVYTAGQFSLKVTDANGVQVFYAPKCPGDSLAAISDYMATVLGAGSASAARVLLGLPSDGTTALRNRLHNGDFRVNQRAVTGTVTLAAGVYGFDRWKAGASGCTFTFSASGSGFILNISSGSLLQVVEGVNVEGGSYALSNQGTAQGRIAVNGAATSGSYAAASTNSPLLSALATGGQTVSVEFSIGTLDRIQLEPGTGATAFERRPYSVELAMCQRYLWRIAAGGFSFMPITPLQTISTTTFQGQIQIPVSLRAAPAVSLTASGAFNVWNSSGTAVAVSALTPSAAPFGIAISGTVASGLIAGGSTYLLGDAGGTAVVQASADL